MSGIRVEDIDDEHGQHNIPPSVWGPPLWKSIHYVALGYPANPTPEERRVYNTFFDQILEHLIPCHVCSENYHRHLVELRATIRALKKRMEAVTIHAIAVSLDFTGDTAGVECAKVKTNYQKARSVRIYGDTKERIQLLTNSIFRLFFGHVYDGLAVLEVKLTTPLNPVLKAYKTRPSGTTSSKTWE
eukprot:gene705-biopygen448